MRRKAFCLLIVLCMLFSGSPMSALAGTNTSDNSTVVKSELSFGDSTGEFSDTDDLLSLYLDETLKDRLDKHVNPLGLSRDLKADMSETTAKVYEILKARVTEVANGQQTSTSVSLSLPDDLGLTISGEADTVEEASADAYAKLELDTDTIVNVLMANCPYDLYWYDKTKGYSWGCSYSYSSSSEEGPFTVTLQDLSFSFSVAEEYAGAGDYTVDANKIASIQTAVDTITSVVEEYSGLGDYDKLTAYKDRICELTSYNYEAAGNTSTPYGNPWQLIWVFDNDPATTVVCEGYAKAFQYLCDLSDFAGDINCYSVTGTMDGGTGAGAHMWNIVHMDDGLNYLVDLTNCDEGTIGAPDQLFLAGVSAGSVESGFTVNCSTGNVDYVYDQNTKCLRV